MRDIMITVTANDDKQATTKKTISEIELGNFVDKGRVVTDSEENIEILNEIIETILNSIDSGYEKSDSDYITVTPLFGMFNVWTYVDEFIAKEISKHTDANEDIIEFLSNDKYITTKKQYTPSEIQFLLRKFKEVRTKMLKAEKIFEVEVFNTETKEYRKLSEYCSAYSIEATGMLLIHKPCIIEIIDGMYKITFKPVIRKKRQELINSSIYRRRIEVCSFAETIRRCIQSL